jgi:putative DNA methylase
MRSTFAKQALPMVWDYAEANPFAKSSAGLQECVKVIADSVEKLPAQPPAKVAQLNAAAFSRHNSKAITCTDPPYYDNIGYADLSDYFYIWLRRSLKPILPDLFSTLLTPKTPELIASPYRHEGSQERAKAFFEEGFGNAFSTIRDAAGSDYPVTVFYAFKQSETDESDDNEGDEPASYEVTVASTGWETMLEGLIRAGFSITGTWPMRTEGDNRQIGIGQNALASSIVLVCRPRPANAPTATRKEFLTTLRTELPSALKALQASNIAPVDLAQAAIGPGMAVFTRFSQVLEAGDQPMSVRTALGLINQTLDEVLAEQEGEFDPATRWAVSWFEQQGLDDGPFGVAETLSKAKNTGVNALAEAGLVVARGGKVHLRKRDELPADWDAADAGCPVWEVTQRLVHALDKTGEAGAAALLPQLGARAEIARELAYRLYTICERKKWATEALAYNGLVIAWPELTRLAQSEHVEPAVQPEMFQEEEGS